MAVPLQLSTKPFLSPHAIPSSLLFHIFFLFRPLTLTRFYCLTQPRIPNRLMIWNPYATVIPMTIPAASLLAAVNAYIYGAATHINATQTDTAVINGA